MKQFDIGDQPTIEASFRDTSGEPADPTTVTLTVKAPDGTEQDVEVTRNSLGEYSGVVEPDQSGMWRYRWAATGALVAAEEGWFYVRIQRVGAS